MSEKEPSSINQLYTFLGCLGAIASFALIAFIAYLPQQADPADQAVKEQRQIKADEARAAGKAKLESYAVVNAEKGIVRIPVDSAMDAVVQQYRNNPSVPAQ
ncbi:MAG: hypothetical protein ACON39_05725 [Coraliomargaritaceae bacterium]